MQGQLVNVKALVRQVGGSKVVSKLSGEKLKKQEAVLVDPFGCVKIVLWENFVDSIECDQTYLFRNLHLKKDHYSSEIYVNTAMYGTEILPTLPFDLPLAEESATQLTVFYQTQIPAEIIGISNLTNHYTCKACNKGLEEKGNFGKCTSCNLTQKLVNTNRRWSAKLFIQVTNEAKTLHVTLYHSMVVRLLEIVDSELDHQTCNDDDLTEVILDCPCIEVKYDNNSKVTELSSFDI